MSDRVCKYMVPALDSPVGYLCTASGRCKCRQKGIDLTKGSTGQNGIESHRNFFDSNHGASVSAVLDTSDLPLLADCDQATAEGFDSNHGARVSDDSGLEPGRYARYFSLHSAVVVKILDIERQDGITVATVKSLKGDWEVWVPITRLQPIYGYTPNDEDTRDRDRKQAGKVWQRTGIYATGGQDYYRYQWGQGDEVKATLHIPGGNRFNPVVTNRAFRVYKAIHWEGKEPHEVIAMIKSWGRRKG